MNKETTRKPYETAKNKKARNSRNALFYIGILVEPSGIEPLTSTLPVIHSKCPNLLILNDFVLICAISKPQKSPKYVIDFKAVFLNTDKDFSTKKPLRPPLNHHPLPAPAGGFLMPGETA